MLRPEEVAAGLRARGELWESGAGVIGMRGSLARLYSSVSTAIAEVAAAHSIDEWVMPKSIAFATLERAQYFQSFPHWLTAASHLTSDEAALEMIASSTSPGKQAACSLEPATSALPPAVCYHTYEALADTTIDSPVMMTAEETCWRHEGSRLAALERGWAFTMREIVYVGESRDAEAFRQTYMSDICGFAESLGLDVRLEVATDPFFAPSARGKGLLQRLKALKHELVIDRPDGSPLAISSFNNHERFFGDAFQIRLGTGGSATSACVAFGIERWMLAIVMTHGLDAASWPHLEASAAGARR